MGAETETGGSPILEVAEWLRIFAVGRVGFARGTARYRRWWEVDHRPLERTSRSLQREFEQVIMVEVSIGEISGSDRSRPRDLRASRGRRCKGQREVHSSERTEKSAQKRFDRADIVRDIR